MDWAATAGAIIAAISTLAPAAVFIYRWHRFWAGRIETLEQVAALLQQRLEDTQRQLRELSARYDEMVARAVHLREAVERFHAAWERGGGGAPRP